MSKITNLPVVNIGVPVTALNLELLLSPCQEPEGGTHLKDKMIMGVLSMLR